MPLAPMPEPRREMFKTAPRTYEQPSMFEPEQPEMKMKGTEPKRQLYQAAEGDSSVMESAVDMLEQMIIPPTESMPLKAMPQPSEQPTQQFSVPR